MAPRQLHSSIPPQELYRLLSQNGSVHLIDVRTPGEFAAASISGSQLFPLDQLDPIAFLQRHRNGSSPLYVLCHSGNRALQAVQKFQAAGFEHCILVEGGIQAWMDAGLPVHRGKSHVPSLMRQVQMTVGLISAAGSLLAYEVDRTFALVPLLMGGGLLFAGITGTCGLALLLAKMPWNHIGPDQNAARCDTSR